jgi:hypothetical protein
LRIRSAGGGEQPEDLGLNVLPSPNQRIGMGEGRGVVAAPKAALDQPGMGGVVPQAPISGQSEDLVCRVFAICPGFRKSEHAKRPDVKG